ncbi:MAG: hypothetical protein EA415_06850, partial [Sphaerobacteraceae bacterium]
MGIRSTQPRHGLFGAGLILAVITGLVLWGFAHVSGQAQNVVTAESSADLIEALEDVGGGEVTIELTEDEYVLNEAYKDSDNGLPTITGDVTIEGNDATIRVRQSSSDIFRVLQVDSGGTLNLYDVMIRGAVNDFSGVVGILNSGGNLALTNTTVSRNTNRSNAIGIRNDGGNLTLTNSTVSGNGGDRGGGGIRKHRGATVTLTNTTVSG